MSPTIFTLPQIHLYFIGVSPRLNDACELVTAGRDTDKPLRFSQRTYIGNIPEDATPGTL